MRHWNGMIFHVELQAKSAVTLRSFKWKIVTRFI